MVRTARLEAPALSAEPSLPAAAEAVLTFLESVGRRSEAELYLGLFRQLPKQSFAIVVTEAAVIRHTRGSLLEQLKFLADLGLVAPVVLGASSPDTALRGASELARHLPRVGLAASQYEMTAPGLGELVSWRPPRGAITAAVVRAGTRGDATRSVRPGGTAGAGAAD